jgi:hypothetical protein
MDNVREITPEILDDSSNVNRAEFLIALAASKDYDSTASLALLNEVLRANAKLQKLKDSMHEDGASC